MPSAIRLAATPIVCDNRLCSRLQIVPEGPTIMSTAAQPPSRPAIEYPTAMGSRWPRTRSSCQWIVMIKEGTGRRCSADRLDVFVAGDLLWYPVEGDNKTRQAPDTLVAFGRPKGRRGSYMQWLEEGIAPQVVFEDPFAGQSSEEIEHKFQFYEQFGVEEYYVYDPIPGPCKAGCDAEEASRRSAGWRASPAPGSVDPLRAGQGAG